MSLGKWREDVVAEAALDGQLWRNAPGVESEAAGLLCPERLRKENRYDFRAS